MISQTETIEKTNDHTSQNDCEQGRPNLPLIITSDNLSLSSDALQSKQELDDYLSKHRVQKGDVYSHTSLGGGSYYFKPNEEQTFMELYARAVKSGIKVHITEKHRNISPILLDIDFRSKNIEVANKKTHVYTPKHIFDFVKQYMKGLSKFVVMDGKTRIFVHTKPARIDKGIVKDGVHVIIPSVITQSAIQYAVRKYLIAKCRNDIFKDIELSEYDFSNIVDEAVIERNNWFLYGSNKPNEKDKWVLTTIYEFDGKDLIEIPTPLSVKLNVSCDQTVKLQIKEDLPIEKCIELFSIRNKFNETKMNSVGHGEVEDYKAKSQKEAQKKIDALETKLSKPKTKKSHTVDFKEACLLVDMLDPKRAEDYYKWWKIGRCLKHTHDDLLSKFIEFSLKSKKHNEWEVKHSCLREWDIPVEVENPLTMGSLHTWAKEDAPDEYEQYMMSKMKSRNIVSQMEEKGCFISDNNQDQIETLLMEIVSENMTHEKGAKLFCMINDKYVFIGDNEYYIRNDFGAFIPVNPSFQKEMVDKTIKETINPLIKEYFSFLMLNISKDQALEPEVKKSKLSSLKKKYVYTVGKIESVGFISGIYETIKQRTLDINAKKHMDEKDLHLVLYQNGVLDLTTMELRNVQKGEYVSMFMGSDLTKQPKDIQPQDFVNADAIVADWLDEDDAKYFKKLIASGLHGGSDQQIIHNFTGSGANAKSKAFEVVEKCFNDLFFKIPLTFYTKPADDAKSPNPHKLKKRGKRVSWLNETGEHDKFISSQFKEEAEDHDEDARNLHSKEVKKVKQRYTSFINSNHPLKFTDDIDYATIRRTRVLKFKNKFVSIEDYDPTDKSHRLIDDNINKKIDNLIEEFNLLWVYYYMVYKKEGLKMTPNIAEATKEYTFSLDIFKVFIGENVGKEQGGKVWIDDLYADYQAFMKIEDIKDVLYKRKFQAKIKNDFTVERNKERGGERRDQYYIVDCMRKVKEEPKKAENTEQVQNIPLRPMVENVAEYVDTLIETEPDGESDLYCEEVCDSDPDSDD